MNWTIISAAALVGGVALISRARRAPAIHDAEQLNEGASWGYFLLLVGSWGVLANFANASDAFFGVMMVAAVLAVVARLRGYKPRGNRRALPAWAAFGFANAAVLAAIGTGKTFAVEPMQIPSSSMRPGLEVGDFILVNKAAYGLRLPFLHTKLLPIGQPARGDVAVFRMPPDPKTSLIKRVVGLPGDRVVYRNKQLTINGVAQPLRDTGSYQYQRESGELVAVQQIEERFAGHPHTILNNPTQPTLNPLLVQDFPGRQACQQDVDGFDCRVPTGQYLVLGDNRDDSNDGRYWGFLPEENLSGKAFMVWMNWAGWGQRPQWDRIGKRIS